MESYYSGKPRQISRALRKLQQPHYAISCAETRVRRRERCRGDIPLLAPAKGEVHNYPDRSALYLLGVPIMWRQQAHHGHCGGLGKVGSLGSSPPTETGAFRATKMSAQFQSKLAALERLVPS